MLELPQKFQNDIQGNTTNLIPLVVIDNRLFLSTNECSLDNHYLPLLSSLGSIRESIDISNKNFQTSNVNLEFYNYEYLDMTLSHKLFSPSVMNKPLTIYLKSQSAETLDDCLMIYTGFIRDIQENNKIVSIDVEDKTQDILDIDLPQEFVRDDIGLPEKYNNKRVPLVYGYVDKAPCVYYNIISSDSEDANSKYSITPDNSFLNQIIRPYVFENDVYLEIKQNASLFSEQSQGTLYESLDREQYTIFETGNRILIDKSIDNYDPTSDEFSSVQSVNGSPISYNFVEVSQESPLTFSGGTYSLLYRENGQRVTARSKIEMYEDLESTNTTRNTIGSYLDVKDFSNMPSYIADGELWAWGRAGFTFVDGVSLSPFQPAGDNLINFESNNFCSESALLKDLAVNETVNKDITGTLQLTFNLETIAELHANISGTNPQSYPHLILKWTDGSSTIWDISANDENNGIFIKDGTTDPINTKNIVNNILSIGCRRYSNGEFIFQNQNGTLQYLKINNLILNRTAIMNNFSNYDLYAEVNGRVDRLQNSVGFYTGEQQQATVSTGNVVGFSSTSSGSSGGGGY